MQSVDEQPETIHLYVVREADIKPSLYPIVLSVLALFALVVFCVFTPYQQPEVRAVIRVPAVLLPPRTFTAEVAIIPTGIRTYPATVAHGWLTFSNGSVIGQSVPVGYVIGNVVTDRSVYVPTGNANGYGVATVQAHVISAGLNLPTLAINEVIGSSLFVRNLSPLTGGRAAYSIKYATNQDKQTALIKSRSIIALQVSGIHYPCTEATKEVHLQNGFVNETSWRCQFVTYSLPLYMHVTGVRIIGKNLLIDVWFVVRPTRIWVK